MADRVVWLLIQPMDRLAYLMAASAQRIQPNEALPMGSKEYLQPVLLNPLLDGPPTVPLVFVGNQRLEFGAVLIELAGQRLDQVGVDRAFDLAAFARGFTALLGKQLLEDEAFPFTLAWLPGVAIHGAGHLYAGSYFKGASLLALEGASIWLGASYGSQIGDDINRLSKANNNNGNSIPTDIAPLTARVGIFSVAAACFIYTWLDDLGGAGIAAQKYNQDQKLAASRVALMPTRDGQGMLLGYTTQF